MDYMTLTDTERAELCEWVYMLGRGSAYKSNNVAYHVVDYVEKEYALEDQYIVVKRWSKQWKYWHYEIKWLYLLFYEYKHNQVEVLKYVRGKETNVEVE